MVDHNSAEIFDIPALARNRMRAARDFHNYDFLFSYCEDQILDRLSLIKRSFQTVLLIGARKSPAFISKLKTQLGADFIVQTDLTQAYFQTAIEDEDKDKNTPPAPSSVICQDDFLPFKGGSFDLILSSFHCHTINDLPGALFQIRRILKPDGLFLSALPGGETLTELRQSLMQTEIETKNGLSPRVFPFADKQDAGALLQRAGFALPVVDSENITVTYAHLFDLIKDLRGMGEQNSLLARNKNHPGREFFLNAARYYSTHFGEPDGRIRAGFEIIFMLGWAPHESQQKPLRPGSAEKSLADALNTQEIKTGETP